jgi:hypothetical protein
MEPPAYRQCAWYDPGEKAEFFRGDGMWNAGKAMSLLAVGVGFIVMCVVLCTCCVAFELPTFDALFWTCLLCFVAQALTFLAWGSDLCDEYECTWASGTGMNITAAMLWVWAANMIKSFPEALPPRGRRSNKRRNEQEAADNEAEESPYLTKNRGFQDEYADGDEFNDWGGEEDHGNANQGYYDENGDWHEPEEPQGYYDDDGNWYDYNQNAETDDGSGYYDDGDASYYTDGEDPLAPQPQSYYGERSTADTDDNPQPTVDDGYAHGYDSGDIGTMSQEEMEFMSVSESQRSINRMD